MTDDKEEERQEGLVLVGFGKHTLADMLEWQDTKREEDLVKEFKKWPPVWREERICSTAEIKTSLQYLAYLQDVILEYDLNRPPEEDKENKDGNR